MAGQIFIRFIIGGVVVSAFAMLGDILKPKSFAGLFGAAPSVAIATLSLSIVANGKLYAAVEAHAMIAGAVALLLYTWMACQVLMRFRWSVLTVAYSMIPVWLAVVFGIWRLTLSGMR